MSREAPGDFDARFSAIRRHYLYRIVSRRSPLALEARRAWWVPKPLDHDAMHEAAQRLVGHHDLHHLPSPTVSDGPLRTLDRLDVTRAGELIKSAATAQSFLHNQIVPSRLPEARGEGKWTPDDLQTALEARDRKACGPVAPRPTGFISCG